jgi:CRISPR/Cas system CSM-associated protein Csm4 (group 5 of RAMP superfamily)
LSKSKERSEVEFLRGIIRQQKSQLKHLQKQLARAEKNTRKNEALYSELTDKDNPVNYATPEVVKETKPKCVKCGSTIFIIDMGFKLLYSCSKSDCKHRQTVLKPTSVKE